MGRDFIWQDTMQLPKIIYLNRNTSLIREKLEILGYSPLDEFSWGDTTLFESLLAFVDDRVYCGFDKEDLRMIIGRDFFVDCENNGVLFLSLAALREDTDINQWFISEEADPQWFLSKSDYCEKRVISFVRWRKATPGEIIVHFRYE